MEGHPLGSGSSWGCTSDSQVFFTSLREASFTALIEKLFPSSLEFDFLCVTLRDMRPTSGLTPRPLR